MRPDRRALFLRHLAAWARSDPYRNALSAVGLILGVAGILVGLALTLGESRAFLERLRLVGVRSLHVTAGRGDLPPVNLEGIRASVPGVERVARLTAARRSVRSAGGPRMRSVPVLGVDEGYFAILAGARVEGRRLTAMDVRTAHPVCVVGRTLYEKLRRPESLEFEGAVLQVVGILEAPQGAGGDLDLAAADPGGAVMVPSSLSWISPLQRDVRPHLLVQVAREGQMEEAARALERLFRRRSAGEIRVESSEALLGRYRATRRHLARNAAALSLLALLLGGLGVMNNMFSVVLERLPEIGVRISMGATRREIVVQFVAETLVVTVAGSLVGMALGLPVVGLLHGLTEAPVALPWWLPVVPPLLGVVIGVTCGALPAARAARERPIGALTFR